MSDTEKDERWRHFVPTGGPGNDPCPKCGLAWFSEPRTWCDLDLHELGYARAELYRLRRERDEAIARAEKAERECDEAVDCGQTVVCKVPPGCQRHWEERCRDLFLECEDAIARAEKAERERDEWRTQHENLLACAAADQRALLRVARAAKAFRDWDAVGALLSGDMPHAEDAQNDLRELDAALSRAEAAEIGCEIAYRREPTQAEGDAHDAGDGECFVPMGSWQGRRCHECRRWEWAHQSAGWWVHEARVLCDACAKETP